MIPALQDRPGRQFDRQTIFQGAVDCPTVDNCSNDE